MEPGQKPAPELKKGTFPGTASVPGTEAAAAPGKRRETGPRVPGEEYTPLPVFEQPDRPRWKYFAVALVLALALALAVFQLDRQQRAAAVNAAPAAVSVETGK